MLDLYFHLCYCWLLFWCWVWDFECLSSGYISLVVDMADGCALWSLCICTSEVTQCLSWNNIKEKNSKLSK